MEVEAEMMVEEVEVEIAKTKICRSPARQPLLERLSAAALSAHRRSRCAAPATEETLT